MTLFLIFTADFSLNIVTFCLKFTIRSNSHEFPTKFAEIQKFPGIPGILEIGPWLLLTASMENFPLIRCRAFESAGALVRSAVSAPLGVRCQFNQLPPTPLSDAGLSRLILKDLGFLGFFKKN